MQGNPVTRQRFAGLAAYEAPRFTYDGTSSILTPVPDLVDAWSFPCVVEVPPAATATAALLPANHRYLLLYSTDHGGGGIYAASAASPLGPFTNYSESPIWKDETEGVGSETPYAVWNPDTSEWHLYYHNHSINDPHSQNTMLATGENGLTDLVRFDRGDGSAQCWVVPEEWRGTGHGGYAKIIRLENGAWIARHLAGGTDWSYSSFSISYDGKNDWMTLPHTPGRRSDLTEDVEIVAGRGELVEWRGKWWGLHTIGGVSSFVTITPRSFHLARMAPDLRTLMPPSVKVMDDPEAGDNDEDARTGMYIAKFGGRLYLYWVGVDASDNRHLMVSVSNHEGAF